MIVFKNDSAIVEWDTISNTIICNWITVSSATKMTDVIDSIIEIQNENDIRNYVSNRSNLTYSWSGIKEWQLFNENSNKQFINVSVIDPNNVSNQLLFQDLINFTEGKEKNYQHKIFRNLKVYHSLKKGYAIK